MVEVTTHSVESFFNTQKHTIDLKQATYQITADMEISFIQLPSILANYNLDYFSKPSYVLNKSTVIINAKVNFPCKMGLKNLDSEMLANSFQNTQTITVHAQIKWTYNTFCWLNQTNRQINKMEIGNTTKLELQPPHKNGIYFIHTEEEDFTITYAITKVQLQQYCLFPFFSNHIFFIFLHQ